MPLAGADPEFFQGGDYFLYPKNDLQFHIQKFLGGDFGKEGGD